MSLMSLNADTLKLVGQLVQNPSAALPAALKALDADGPWDLLTQRVRSEQVKVSAGQAELSLPLLAASTAQSGALSSRWQWSATAEANAALSLDLLADADLAELAVQPDAGHTLVAYGASLALGGSLGAKTSVPAWGRAGLSVAGQRSGTVRWFVQAKDDGTLLDALQSAQRHFVSPHDLQAMLRLANRTDWYGLELALQGEAQLQLEIAAKATGTGWTFNLDGQQSGVGLSAALDASFGVRRASDWRLRVTVAPRDPGVPGSRLGLKVALHDLRQTQQQGAVSLSAGADFSAVTANAERVLRAAWPALDNDLLDALSRPGAALGSKLRQLIDTRLDGALQDLVTVLAGGQPASTLRDQLVDQLSGGLGEVLDGALGDISAGQADAKALLDAWLKRVLGPAAEAVTIDEKLKKVVNDALEQATQGLEAAIRKLQDGLVGKAQQKVDALLKTLGELGAQFEGQLTQLDENAASVAIRSALARYAALRQKLLAALTEASRQKLTLTLAATWQRDAADEAVFEAWFAPADTPSPEAERLYHAVCSGRLLALPALVAAATAVGAVAQAKGWLLSTARSLSTERVTLNFFGIQISSGTSWLREVSVKTDLLTGQLLLATGSASVETFIANPWKNRHARLGVQLTLTDAGTPAASLGAALYGGFTADKERSASRSVVQQLLDAYAQAVGSPPTDVRLMMPIPSGPAEKAFWRQLTLAIPVALDAAQWARFAAQAPDEIDRVALEIALRQFARRHAEDSLFPDGPLVVLRQLAATHLQKSAIGPAELLDYLKRFPEGHVSRHSAAGPANALDIPAVQAGGTADRGTRIFLALHRLSATVQAPRRLHALSRQAADQVRAAPVPVDPAALRHALEGVLRQMQDALSPVALVSETWLGIGLGGAADEPVSWPFVSFVSTMARLSGQPLPPGFVPVARSGDQPAMPLLPPA